MKTTSMNGKTRREFIQGLAIAGGGTALSPIVYGTELLGERMGTGVYVFAYSHDWPNNHSKIRWAESGPFNDFNDAREAMQKKAKETPESFNDVDYLYFCDFDNNLEKKVGVCRLYNGEVIIWTGSNVIVVSRPKPNSTRNFAQLQLSTLVFDNLQYAEHIMKEAAIENNPTLYDIESLLFFECDQTMAALLQDVKAIHGEEDAPSELSRILLKYDSYQELQEWKVIHTNGKIEFQERKAA